jgi:hypothetical protein
MFFFQLELTRMVWWSVGLLHWRYPNRFDHQFLGLTEVCRDTFVVESVADINITVISNKG